MSGEIETPTNVPLARTQSRRRAAGAWIVLFLAGLLLLLSSFAIWIDRVALNTAVFTDTSSSLLDDARIRSAVANRAVDELFANVDVQEELESQLPADYQGLSGPLTAAGREGAYRVVERALEQPVFQDLFRVAVRESHTTLVEVLEGGHRVSTRDGEVTLDLRAIVLEAAERIGIGDQVEGKLPPDAGEIVVLRSDELDTAQNAFQLLETIAWLLPILTALVLGIAVWLAPDRRHAARAVGVVLVVVGAVGLAAARLTRTYLVDSLVARPDDREAAGNAWDILTELMRGSFRFMVAVGVLFLLSAWLAGPGRRALTARGWLAPAFVTRSWAYVTLALVAVVLVLTSDVSDGSRALVVTVLVALGAIWIELTRRQTLAEFPDARGTAFLSDTWARVSTWWNERRTTAAPSMQAPAAPPAGDLTSRLAALFELHEKGALTDGEYAAAKTRVLAGE